MVSRWGGKGGQLELRISAPGGLGLGRRFALGLAADDRVRGAVTSLVGCLPAGLGDRLRRRLRPKS